MKPLHYQNTVLQGIRVCDPLDQRRRHFYPGQVVEMERRSNFDTLISIHDSLFIEILIIVFIVVKIVFIHRF